MRIDPINSKNDDPFQHLTITQKIARRLAIAMVFCGVFYWFIKIVIG